MEEFSIALNYILETRDVTAKELAEIVGLNPVSISHYRRGVRQGSEATRREIAAALGYGYDELLALGSELLKLNDAQLLQKIEKDKAEGGTNEMADEHLNEVIKALREQICDLRAQIADLQKQRDEWQEQAKDLLRGGIRPAVLDRPNKDKTNLGSG